MVGGSSLAIGLHELRQAAHVTGCLDQRHTTSHDPVNHGLVLAFDQDDGGTHISGVRAAARCSLGQVRNGAVEIEPGGRESAHGCRTLTIYEMSPRGAVLT